MRRLARISPVARRLRDVLRRGTDTGDIGSILGAHRSSAAIAAAVQVGAIDRLAESAATAEELAQALGCDADALGRLLRLLRALGIVHAVGGRYSLTEAGLGLRRGEPLGDFALLTGAEYIPAWSALLHSVMTGEPVFNRVFGMTAWEHRAAQPELDESFNRFMARVQKRTAAAVTEAFDFSRSRLVVDVGGGRGIVLGEILRANPAASGVLFDQAHVTGAAQKGLEEQGVLARCTIAGGSFLDAVPKGGDVYLLQRVLHDWDDANAALILRNCRRAMAPDGTVLIVENVLPADGSLSVDAALRDMHMLAVHGGRERTEHEYAHLLSVAELMLVQCIRSHPTTDVIVARPPS